MSNLNNKETVAMMARIAELEAMQAELKALKAGRLTRHVLGKPKGCYLSIRFAAHACHSLCWTVGAHH